MRPGEVVGFLGPNGAGKTTTVRMISCFLPPTSGTALIYGVDVREKPREVKRMLGICPQEDNLDPDFDVLKNLLVYGRYFGIPAADVKRRAESLLEMVALGDKAKSAIAALSGGMKRRLVLARALLNEPRVLILDEPTTGLDPNQQQDMRELIRALGRERTVILSTHILPEVEAVCDRALIIKDGRLVADGTIDEIRALATGRSAREGVALVTVRASREQAEQVFRALPFVSRVEDAGLADAAGTTTVRLVLARAPEATELEQVAAACFERRLPLSRLAPVEAELEDVFAMLTGGDGEPADGGPTAGEPARG